MEAVKLLEIILGTAMLEKINLLMFWNQLLPYQAVVYMGKNNEMKVILGTHQWEGEYHSLTS